MPVMGGMECLDEIIKRYGEERPTTIAISTTTRQVLKSKSAQLFHDWWDKTDQNILMKGMSKLIDIKFSC
jgi:CheY-like chemotaxis protein|tara:strand:- start:36 stop:245 length:210 start_codon:yes stop_codon:yes gene_type:complete